MASDDSRRNQVTTVGWLGTQGVGEAIERFAVMAQTLVRRRGLDGDNRRRREKQSKERKNDDGTRALYGSQGSKEANSSTLLVPARSQGRHECVWNREEGRWRCS